MNKKEKIELTNSKVEFPTDVILIDSAYLDFVAGDVRRHFSRVLGRELGGADITVLMPCLALDAGFAAAAADGTDRQVYMVYDKKSVSLNACLPANIEKELHGNAFSSPQGEFAFSGVTTEGMVGAEDLFIELLTLVADSKDTKRIILVANEESYAQRIDKVVSQGSAAGKEFVRFVMRPDCEPVSNTRFEILVYPLMQALGIRGDEL